MERNLEVSIVALENAFRYRPLLLQFNPHQALAQITYLAKRIIQAKDWLARGFALRFVHVKQ
jgi:hypothetical protein